MAANGLILNVKLQIMGGGVDLDVQLKTTDKRHVLRYRFRTIIKLLEVDAMQVHLWQ